MNPEIKDRLKKISLILSVIATPLVIVSFFYNNFTSKELHDKDVKQIKENINSVDKTSADILEEILHEQKELNLKIERVDELILLRTYRTRRNFLMSRPDLTSLQEKELELLEQEIEELLQLLSN